MHPDPLRAIRYIVAGEDLVHGSEREGPRTGAGASPWSLPLTPMDQILSGYDVTDRTQRVRGHGTITYYQPGSSVVLQDGNKSLRITTQTIDPLRVGDVADASGFPESHSWSLALAHGEIQDSHVYAPIAPFATTREEL